MLRKAYILRIDLPVEMSKQSLALLSYAFVYLLDDLKHVRREKQKSAAKKRDSLRFYAHHL
jgi:hypothetical protein